MDAAEYKHVVLGLIFPKYISDAFEEQHRKLEAERVEGADPEDPDEYRAQNIFWVPPEARWAYLKAQARQPTIGQLVDNAMAGIERDNPALQGVLPKDYARPGLDKTRLGQLIELISNFYFRSDQPSPRLDSHPLPVGEGLGMKDTETEGARYCSSTPASWAAWWTARTVNSPTRNRAKIA